ncbi:hypothetical protein TRVL_04334 [Trypanosoma vivax]|nr:hypothetical protein TRVL_04334 [Trypanosoma vivax]
MRLRVVKALQNNFRDAVIRQRTASEVLQQIVRAPTNEVENAKGTYGPLKNASELSINTSTRNEPASLEDTACKDEVDTLAHSECFTVDVVTTEAAIRGKQLVEKLAKMVVGTFLHEGSCIPKNVDMERNSQENRNRYSVPKPLHVFAFIGGDGSLSDAVNGLCFGTLDAYRQAFPSEHTGDSDVSYTTSSSNEYYWRTLEDRAILRHFLPPVIYLPAGTGSDFARLGLCCHNEKELVSVLRGISMQVTSPAASQATCNLESQSTPSNSAGTAACSFGSDSICSNRMNTSIPRDNLTSYGFVAHNVDVCRMTFPRTGNTYFFINECSCGMSCDVISRCEKLKGMKMISRIGGSLMFGIAAVGSAIRMKPMNYRIMPLPPAPSMCRREGDLYTPAGGQLHPHHLSAAMAFHGFRQESVWLSCYRRSKDMLPPNEPLRVGADYYAYECRREESASSTLYKVEEQMGVSSDDSSCDFECTTNPFYVNWSSRRASTSEQILSSINSGDASKSWLSITSSTIVFGNGRWFGGGMQVAPHADPTDGLLSITNWSASTLQFASRLPTLYSGRHQDWSCSTMWKAGRCIIDAEPTPTPTPTSDAPYGSSVGRRKRDVNVWVEADGELRERLPAIVEVSAPITVIAPLRNK